MLYIIHQLALLLPVNLRKFLFSKYHLLLAYLGALYYQFPSRKLVVIAVTGTKGKTTVTEIMNAILEESGKKTILTNTIRFKIGNESKRNLRKMSMPGRFFLQQILAKGLRDGATHAVLEMTSEGAVQNRHRYIDIDALIFTNLAPEHIESHGSLEAYGNAKLRIARQLEISSKRPRIVVAPTDDVWGKKFLDSTVDRKIGWSLKEIQYQTDQNGISFTIDSVRFESPLPGEANVKNAVEAVLLGRELEIPVEFMQSALKKLKTVPGRFENVNEGGKFPIIIDYAHTPESLEEVYKAFEGRRRICVLGATGGGRDKWKRPVFGKLAEKYCAEIFLTNEDPYDEDPASIIEEIALGIETKKPTIIVDRREAIREAVIHAKEGDAVLITGKGTDPFIMGSKDSKTPWSDADIAREMLKQKEVQ